MSDLRWLLNPLCGLCIAGAVTVSGAVAVSGAPVEQPATRDDAEHAAAAPSAEPATPSATPEWIWADTDRRAGRQVLLYRDVVLPAGISGARVRLAVDFAHCQLIINGQLQADLDAYGPTIDVDITDAVRAGDNRVQLRLSSVAGPAAAALSMTADTGAGEQPVLITDDQWRWRDAAAAESGADLPDDEQGDNHNDQPVTSFGNVARHVWHARANITAIDDYTQWKRAAGSDPHSDPAAVMTLPGFAVDLLHTAQPDEGSWVSMAVDDRSRLTIAREDKGLLRITLSPEGNQVQVIDDTLAECRGLLYAHGSLYANANGSKGLYRLRDTDGDDRFDDVDLLHSWPGGGGHGRNDLALGPDGWIYVIHGDSVDLPSEDVTDFTSPLRAARRGKPSREGHLLRTDANGTNWQLVASGLRNPFGIDFHADGEPFTYDADAEFDMGAPWYRCTRIVPLVLGGDFGWRGETGQWPPYLLDRADNALPAGDIGKGSPTAVKFGRRSAFPAPYRDALFVLDWAYGRVLACHLQPRGGGYRCAAETFLQGRPLNVTDLDFGPDGQMYLITGGRQTQSALYRIRYVGDPTGDRQVTQQQRARDAFGQPRRALRRRLETLLTAAAPDPINVAWPHLGDPDPTIRYAARLVIEHQPVEQWAERALAETDPPAAVTALLAVARSGQPDAIETVVGRLNRLPLAELSPYDQLGLLQAYRLCLSDQQALADATLAETRQRVRQWLMAASQHDACAPVGAGSPITRGLGLLAVDLQVDSIVPLLIAQLTTARSQADRLHWLFALRSVQHGWTLPQRQAYFTALSDLERTAVGGEGMPATLSRIRSDAAATLTAAEEENVALAALVRPVAASARPTLTVSRPTVRSWQMDDVPEILRIAAAAAADPAKGSRLFDQVLCSQCHRVGVRGGALGPDLTSVASRFSRGDMLKSIIAPSLVVAQQYQGVRLLTHSGNVITGRVLTGGDYRAAALRVATDPTRPFDFVEISKSDIQWYGPSDQSPMPTGLLDSLTAVEIGHLLAFLEAGGAGLASGEQPTRSSTGRQP